MLDRRLIGKQYGPTLNEIERGAIRRFAQAIGDLHPVHHDVTSAQAAGHANLLAPPTFAASLDSALQLFQELQIDPRNTTLVEQSFEYHLPICAGDTISVTSRIVEIYEKPVPGGSWEFVVTEDDGRDPKGALIYRSRRTLGIRPPPKAQQSVTAVSNVR